jgi:putative heme degradation protein
MSDAERQAQSFALNYEVGTRVHTGIVPLASEIEQTMLAGAQHSATLEQATAGVMQQQAQIQAQEGVAMSGLVLQGQEQMRAYTEMATGLRITAENALSSSQLQATQLMVGAMMNAAQLYQDYNPVSFLSGFLNLLAVPREVWQRNLGYDMEVA